MDAIYYQQQRAVSFTPPTLDDAVRYAKGGEPIKAIQAYLFLLTKNPENQVFDQLTSFLCSLKGSPDLDGVVRYCEYVHHQGSRIASLILASIHIVLIKNFDMAYFCAIEAYKSEDKAIKDRAADYIGYVARFGGDSIGPNLREARGYSMEAYNSENPEIVIRAALNLAFMDKTGGPDEAPNLREAYGKFKFVFESGTGEMKCIAGIELGWSYETGAYGGDPDYLKASSCYTEALKSEQTEIRVHAQSRLAALSEAGGYGIEQDIGRAFTYYKMVCYTSKNPETKLDASMSMGALALRGGHNGVGRNLGIARDCFEEVYNSGNVERRDRVALSLGVIYKIGDVDVKRNPGLAHKYLVVASKSANAEISANAERLLLDLKRAHDTQDNKTNSKRARVATTHSKRPETK